MNTPPPWRKDGSDPMNSSLVPTVIVNRNGVITTVHKKPLNLSGGRWLISRIATLMI